MAKIVALLQQDHVHFLKILNALEHQAHIAARGGAPDRRYIRSIIDYFQGAPRRNHYQREEILLRMLEQRAPRLAAKITTILRYHRTLDKRLADLERCFVLFEKNAEQGRAAFVTAAIRFAEFEKAHFVDEDAHLFPAARSALSEAELDCDSPLFPRGTDASADACPAAPAPSVHTGDCCGSAPPRA